MAKFQRPAMVIFAQERTLFQPIKQNIREGVKAVVTAVAQEGIYYDTEKLCAEFEKLTGEFWIKSEYRPRSHVSSEMIWKYLIALFEMETKKSPAQLDRIFSEAACRLVPTEGAADILELLSNCLVRTAVAADIPYSAAWMEDVLDASFPNNMLEFTLCSSEFIYGREDAEFFEILQKKADIPAGDIWYIGGDSVLDVEAAEKAGFVPFWFRGALPETGIKPPRCDYSSVEDWREFASIISKVVRL
ncbi:MAG: hypothetical protein E7487_03815 [Ruminococcaceae bacterium]|nr:hypothetical protein [Oscillospiraceae bacterium]